jgi:hypothetical protein
MGYPTTGPDGDGRLNNKVFSADYRCGGASYTMWFFDDGFWHNYGPAGYETWCMDGWFDKNGASVAFRKP